MVWAHTPERRRAQRHVAACARFVPAVVLHGVLFPDIAMHACFGSVQPSALGLAATAQTALVLNNLALDIFCLSMQQPQIHLWPRVAQVPPSKAQRKESAAAKRSRDGTAAAASAPPHPPSHYTLTLDDMKALDYPLPVRACARVYSKSACEVIGDIQSQFLFVASKLAGFCA